jgi:hypothetical protein
MGDRPTPQHTIERIDNNQGYSKKNCRWATRKEQMRNMRRNRIVEYKGKKMALVVAAELAGVNYGTAKWRIERGRSIDGTSP